ncbi:MAG: MFS transporter [Planctomycetota bacterium]|nr:MFS transporter [Planctomycetota bacterium]
MGEASGGEAPSGQGVAPRSRGDGLRNNLRCSIVDGTAYMCMVGVAEAYFQAFALELGLGEVVAGLITTVPLLIAAGLNLLTPFFVRRLGSYRLWVAGTAAFQSLSLIPLIVVAIVGTVPAWLLFGLVAMYLAGAIMGGPAWQAWMAVMVPRRLRAGFFAKRNRWLQAGQFVSIIFAGVAIRVSNLVDGTARAEEQSADGHEGAELAPGQVKAGSAVDTAVGGDASSPAAELGAPVGGEGDASLSLMDWHGGDLTLLTFAGLFVVAALCRAVSTIYLFKQTEPRPIPHTERGVGVRAFIHRLMHGREGPVIAYILAFQFALQAALPYWTPYVREELGLDYAAYVLLQAGLFLGRMLALPILGRIATLWGPTRVLVGAGWAVIPTSLLWLSSPSPWALFAAHLVIGAILAAFELASFILLLETTTSEERTSVLAKHTLLQSLAMVGGASFGGWLLSMGSDAAGGYGLVFIAAVALKALTLPFLWRLQRSMRAARARESRSES